MDRVEKVLIEEHRKKMKLLEQRGGWCDGDVAGI